MSSVLSCQSPATTSASIKDGKVNSSHLHFKIFEKEETVPLDWNFLIQEENLLLTKKYLKVIEELRAKGFSFYYVLFYRGEEPIGLAYFQVIPFKFSKSLGHTVNRFHQKISLPLADQILRIKLLVCGSAFLTGEFGYFFKPIPLNANQQQQWLIRAAKAIRRQKERTVNILLVKDLPETHSPISDLYQKQAFSNNGMQPAMKLHLKEEWEQMDDYLNAMSSKYRVRYRRARKKNKDVIRKELEVEDARRLSGQLYGLYLEIASKADFNVAHLPENYFAEFKAAFPKSFRIFAYYVKEQLIGFCTTFLNYSELEAHFLGFQQQSNHQYQLYLNMLYDMVEIGIQNKVKSINFARTALEIKSSIGAVPQVYTSFFKHTNYLPNALMPIIINLFEPKVEWVQRHPFK